MNIIFLVVSCQIIFRRGVQVPEVYSWIEYLLRTSISTWESETLANNVFQYWILLIKAAWKKKIIIIKIEDYIELVLKLFTDWFELHTADRKQKLKVSFLQLSYYGRPICALTFKK